MISLLFLMMGDEHSSLIDIWHLLWPVIKIPVNTCDTTKMGMICHRYGILAPVTVPVKPATWLPRVAPVLYPTCMMENQHQQDSIFLLGL